MTIQVIAGIAAPSGYSDSRIAKLAVVAEGADEAVHWLEFVAASGLADPERIGPLLAEAKELRAMFAASYATSRRGK